MNQYIDICKIAIPLIDKAKVQDRVKDLAQELAGMDANEAVTVFWIANGAMFFAADFIREIGFRKKDLIPEMIRARSYYGRTSTELKHDADLINFERHSGRRIILLDDVLDTGRTLHVLGNLVRQRIPGSTPEAVALVKKEGCQNFDVPLTAVGFTVHKKPWLIGYGMDDDNYYRAEPGIWAKVIEGWPHASNEVPVSVGDRPLSQWAEDRKMERRWPRL